ncbi:hypothetical protein PI124_g9166 [Phytophthora idaei]|nr:hypothetical protein PI125_g11623 [Phytophthora idaei]KAG3137785.1 hypothetical protein PI126_g17216 [Phytophthora idaei]KAG3246100.1 hypothetical protein PI124_g9166 [Phytophthora idaei]
MAYSPNSSRVVAAEPPLDPRDSSSVGGQLREVITTNDAGFTRSDVIGDEEGAIASGDSVNSRDQMTAYDQIRRNSDTEDDDDDETMGGEEQDLLHGFVRHHFDGQQELDVPMSVSKTTKLKFLPA